MKDNTEFNENVKYSISYYGVDFPIDSLVRRLEEEEFIIPDFQRKYVWDSKEASRFIESILLRLPVPAIFLAKDKHSHKLIVIDGQQRLKTLLYFTRGEFPNGKKFILKNVVPLYEGRTFLDLDIIDKREFNNAVIHALVLNETEESDAMFHVFERINTTGTTLTSQEIRFALYRGGLNDLLGELSETPNWKVLYDKKNDRRIDEETILRFLALSYNFDNYNGDLKSFLNDFMLTHKDIDDKHLNEYRQIFNYTMEVILEGIGKDAFKTSKNIFNKAQFDAISVSISKLIREQSFDMVNNLRTKFEELIALDDYQKSIKGATSSKHNVFNRIELAKSIFTNNNA